MTEVCKPLTIEDETKLQNKFINSFLGEFYQLKSYLLRITQ